MVTAEEVRKLALLARIGVSDAECVQFAAEFETILAYIGQLESLELPETGTVLPPHRNLLREDTQPREGGTYTETLAAQFPAREGDALSVRQIISHD